MIGSGGKQVCPGPRAIVWMAPDKSPLLRTEFRTWYYSSCGVMKTDRPRELMQDCSPVALAVCGWGQSYDVCTPLGGHPGYEGCDYLAGGKAGGGGG